MENCCLPLLRGEEHASSPEILMRSRFTAYALGGFGEYLLKTWIPEKRLLLTTEELSCKSTDWKALEILNQSTEKEKAFVEFRAYYVDGNGIMQVHHEKSLFFKIRESWFYSHAV